MRFGRQGTLRRNNDFATTNDVITQVGDATTVRQSRHHRRNAITRNDGYLTFNRDSVSLALVANEESGGATAANTNLNLKQSQPGGMFAKAMTEQPSTTSSCIWAATARLQYHGFTAGIDLVADVIAQDITGIINSANGRDISSDDGTDNTLNILQTIVGTAIPAPTHLPRTDLLTSFSTCLETISSKNTWLT